MDETEPSQSVAKRDEGLALADALVQSSRRNQPLSAIAHARVKHRLHQSLSRQRIRNHRWMRPMVMAGFLLVCGTAFGVVIERNATQHRSVPDPPLTLPTDSTIHRGPRVPKLAKVPIGLILTMTPENESAHTPSDAGPFLQGTPRTTSPTDGAGSLPMVHTMATKRTQPLRAVFPSEPPVSMAMVAPSLLAPAADSSVIHFVPAPASAVRPTGEVSTHKSAQPDPSEEQLLAAAVRALRVEQNSVSALFALDRYQARYPHGRLFLESRILRVDALLKLDRWNEALLSFDTLDLTRLPGGAERCLQRGELRLRNQRWRDAVIDFDWVLSHQHDDHSVERVLRGRMQCRVRLGELQGARADAVEYLRRFPSGPFVGQARDINGINYR